MDPTKMKSFIGANDEETVNQVAKPGYRTLKKYFNPKNMKMLSQSLEKRRPARHSFRSASNIKKGRLTRYILGDQNQLYVSRVN